MSCGRGYECSECGRRFGGLAGFDLHHVRTTGQPGYDPEYDFRCGTDAELTARGLHVDRGGLWVREASFRSTPTPSRGVSPETSGEVAPMAGNGTGKDKGLDPVAAVSRP
jgi:hypothetical protein